MDVPMANCPAFFKVFLPANSARELEIPSSFIQSIEGALPGNVVLRDRYNNLWPVKVEKVGSHWYFKDGWTNCVADNIIEGGDIIVFKYYHEGVFDIKSLGPSACEKKGVGGPKTEEQENMPEEEDKEEGETEDDDFVVTSQQENEQENDDDGEQGMDGGAGTSGVRRRNKTIDDFYGAEIFRAGLAPLPTNPYFVTKTKLTRTSELYIPRDLITHHNLALPQVISLVDPNGRRFSGKRKVWKDGRVFYTRGWKTLCKMNLVEREDFCICEFVRGGNGELYLNVSIIRANMI